MASLTSGVELTLFLLSSYSVFNENSQAILELWGSQEGITKGIIKDLAGKQVSEIPPTSFFGGEDRSITGPALLTYLKATQLSAVLYIQEKKEVVWLVPSIVDVKREKTSYKSLLGGDFLEVIRQNCRTKADLKKFGTQLLSSGSQAYQCSHFFETTVWLTKALFIFILLEDKKNIRACYGGLGNAYRSLGEYRKAIEYHEKSLQFTKEMGDKIGEGCAYGDLGIVYDSLGDYCKAIECHEKDLQITKEVGDKTGARFASGNLGNAYFSLGNYCKAVEYYEKCLQIAKEVGDKNAEGAAYGNLGNVYDSFGDYRKAIEYHEKCLLIAKEVGDKAGEGGASSGLGNAFQSLGDYRKAIEYHEKHRQIAEETEGKAGEGAAYGNLGIAYDSLGDYREAVECYEKQRQIAKEIGDKLGEGTAHGNLGIAYNSLGDYCKAIEYHEKHLQIAKEIGDKAGEGCVYGNLGDAYNSLGEHGKAIRYHEKNLQIAKEIEKRAGEGVANYGLGQSLFMLQKYSKSKDAFIRTIAILSDIQANLEHDAWKISIFEEQSKAYGALEKNYFVTGNVEQALEICEKGRARALFDLYCNRLEFSKKECEERGNITLEKMQAVAKREKTTLVYFSKSFDNDLHIWVVKGDRVHSKKVELPEDFKTEAVPLHKREEPARSLMDDYLPTRGPSLANFSAQSKEDKEQVDPNVPLSEGLGKCYQMLIAPIEEWLDGERLTIITDATMRDVPFTALYKNGPNGREYLIDRFIISMAPSARIFDLIHQIKPKRDGSALIVADPAIKEDRLPGAKAEGKTLSQKIPNSTLLVDDAATIEAVKQAASEASILHFACHGSADAMINKESVFEGALYLTNGQGEKEMLFADEIQKLDLKADLVFLSACQTGKGAQRREGIIGLSRAFLGAGVPSVIATHWSISDYITQSIASDFYDGILNKNMTKANALREAMLIQRKAHPDNAYLWGAFFLIGK